MIRRNEIRLDIERCERGWAARGSIRGEGWLRLGELRCVSILSGRENVYRWKD